MENLFNDIIRSIITVEKLNSSYRKFPHFLNIKNIIEFRSLVSKLEERINALNDDRWTVEYLTSMNRALCAHYNYLSECLNMFNISIGDVNSTTFSFKPISIIDDKGNFIMLSVYGKTISFDVYNPASSESISPVSENETSKSQKKLETIFKQKIIEMLKFQLKCASSSEQKKEKLISNKTLESIKQKS